MIETAAPAASSEAAVPPAAVAESQRAAAEVPVTDGDATEILRNLGVLEDDETPIDIAAESAKADKAEAKGKDGEKDEPDAKADAEDEDTKNLREINARSLKRRRAREASGRPAPVAAATKPAEAAATAQTPAAKTAEAAADAAKAAGGADKATVQAMQDVLAQIARLAGEDDDAVKAAEAAGKPDPGAKARAEELVALRQTVEKVADGLKETDALKVKLDAVTEKLQAQEDDRIVTAHVSRQLDAVAKDAPTLLARRDAVDLVKAAATKFFTKYGQPPDVKEIARRIEKKLQGSGPEKNGETTSATRKTVSTNSHSSPPAQRQGPDKRSGKEAEADFYKRLGVDA